MSYRIPVPLSDYPVHDGTLMMPFPKLMEDIHGQMEKIRNLDINPDDILLCAYPKSGTHWLNEIVYMLINQTVVLSKHPKEDFSLESMDLNTLHDHPCPRVLNTHVRYRHMPKDHLTKGGKVIRITRNPKDILVSLFNHSVRSKTLAGINKTWPEFFTMSCSNKLDLYGGWFNYEREWEVVKQQYPDFKILVLYYEDLNRNPFSEIQRIANFLEVQSTENLVQEIAENCHISNMRQKKCDRSAVNSLDGKSFIYRKGVVGDWKNWFTVSQNEIFDKMYAEQMKNSKLRITFQ